LEEELNFAKELASNESKFALVAKKAAEDAIKQVGAAVAALSFFFSHLSSSSSSASALPDDLS
jgi:hypothetical protein